MAMTLLLTMTVMMMNNILINGRVYNLDKFATITFAGGELILADISNDDTYTVETGPEALAAWEWLKGTCQWRMPEVEPVASLSPVWDKLDDRLVHFQKRLADAVSGEEWSLKLDDLTMTITNDDDDGERFFIGDLIALARLAR